jgi:hypothetical protein
MPRALQIRDSLRSGSDRLRRICAGGGSRLAGIAALALVAMAALVYVACAYSAVRALRAALHEGDGAALAARVDLANASTSLKEQIGILLAEAEANSPRPGTGAVVIGRVGPSVARTLAGPLIDRIFTPEGLADFLKREGSPALDLVRIAKGPPPPSSQASAAAVNPPARTWLDGVESMGFRTPARFEVQVPGGWTLRLRAHGLRWKVYDVRVPPDLFTR